MSAMAAINQRLQDTSGVTALVSTRIYSHTLPQGIAYPALVLADVSTTHGQHLSGSAGWAHAQIQIDAWATTYAAAFALAEAVRAALQRPGDFSVVTDVGTISVDGVHVVADNSAALRPEAGSRNSLVRKSLTYGVSYYEAIPS